MHCLRMRVRRSWAKIQSQNGARRYCRVVKICTFLNNYMIFEETNCIATLRTNRHTKLQSLIEIDFLRYSLVSISLYLSCLSYNKNS